MRISNRMLINILQTNIHNASIRMTDLQTKISSTKRLNVPSDDPAGTTLALSLRSSISNHEQWIRTIDTTQTWLTVTESSVKSLIDTVQKVNNVTLKAVSDTMGIEQTRVLADQVKELLQQVIQEGNSTIAGEYIFSGSKTSTPPFVYNPGPPPSVSYNGNSEVMSRTIGKGIKMDVNIPGDSLFPPITNLLIELRDNLYNNDKAALRTRLDEISASLDNLLGINGELAAKQARLEATKLRYETIKLNLSSTLSQTEDLDFAQAITEFNGQSTVYQAALQSAGKITQYSLLDYLR